MVVRPESLSTGAIDDKLGGTKPNQGMHMNTSVARWMAMLCAAALAACSYDPAF